ncbi:uncharacterized protein LOC127263963 [Andrographis paniculata]|uniref:uncharacterized protein LOC127263963 n=1 Tax=Andrographis paniculata TaxID=175694 RepID=UPI0021E8D3C4|nr:uncharacterized protein LOC127263963 [Andrographis paniculata]
MFKITSQLRHCGEKKSESDMMEKTFSTFHASNMVLQQQYHERGFQKYSELITCLLLAEQNNELLLKNHESRPICANPFPEENAIQPANPVHGRGQRFNTGRNRNNDEEYTRCGIKGHWAYVCRTASHLAELYRASKGRQGRVAAETNHAAHDDTFDDVMNKNITHLDTDDLLDIADDVK